MKKIITGMTLLLAFLLCTMTASARTIPSVTLGDLTQIEVTVENPQDGAGFFLRLVAETEEEHAARWDACRTEIDRIAQAQSLQSYFAQAVDTQGVPFDVEAFLDAQALSCHEFAPIIAGNYAEEMGLVTASFLFPTPYEKDEQVVVMIGLVSVDEAGVQSVMWTAHPGIGVEADDQSIRIHTELTPEMVIGIQEGVALLAVISE